MEKKKNSIPAVAEEYVSRRRQARPTGGGPVPLRMQKRPRKLWGSELEQQLSLVSAPFKWVQGELIDTTPYGRVYLALTAVSP
ncbi:ste ste11 protein kinase [Moniliophthora roreri]|nr:ste ste11 protein kinase [Moniliophthora roreri]